MLGNLLSASADLISGSAASFHLLSFIQIVFWFPLLLFVSLKELQQQSKSSPFGINKVLTKVKGSEGPFPNWPKADLSIH